MKRIIALMLALIFVMSALVACNGNDGPAADTTTGSGDDVGEAELLEPIKLADSNEKYYEVVRPDNEKIAEFKDYMTRIVTNIEAKSGIRLTPNTDWVKPGTDTSISHEILIGYTDREETRRVMASIGFDDFAIRAEGNKIVIAAHTLPRLLQAVGYFVNNLIKIEKAEDGTTSVYFTENYHMKSEKSFVFNDDNLISGYTVVCDTNNEETYKAAQNFVAALKKFNETELEIKDHSAPETECEILIGRTDREVSKQFFTGENAVTGVGYVFASVGKKIVIGSAADNMTVVGVESFAQQLLNKAYSFTFNIELDSKNMNSAYTFKENAEEAEGTDIRVMSYNILSEEWAEEAKVLDGRDTASVATIFNFDADVVGLQEVSANWYKRLDKLLGTKYKFVDRKNTKGETNYSPLIYNTEKVRVIENGVKIYSKGNSSKLRLMSWALFETLDTGKQFIVINTHWDLSNNDDKGYRETHSKEMAEYALELQAKYDCPIITTGDYNASERETMYKNFVEKTGFHEAKYTAKVINKACKTTHKLGVAVSTERANSIDHIFGSTDVEFLYFDVLVNDVVTDASDHNPIYADIKLK